MIRLHEVFVSVQGEGRHLGEPMVFVRLHGCNLKCSKAKQGFDCDTPQDNSVLEMSAKQLTEVILELCDEYNLRKVLFTGGEPLMQIKELTPVLNKLKNFGMWLAVETNGTYPIPTAFNWTSVSPKPGHPCHPLVPGVRIREVKVVLTTGQKIPESLPPAATYWVQPAAPATDEVVQWCYQQVIAAGPPWRLGIQAHKIWRVR